MSDDVIGYLTTCEACGGRALTLHQHGTAWRCPTCTDFAAAVSSPGRAERIGPHAATVESTEMSVRLPAEFDTPTGIAALLRHHGVDVEFAPAAARDVDDSEYPIGQVQG